MKVYNKIPDTFDLLPGLKKVLKEIRKNKKFNVNDYIDKKCKILNEYMNLFELNAAVVAVSGGIDSSVTLAIVKKASEYENSPIKKIVPLLLPCYNDGATHQFVATHQAEILCNSLELEPFIFDLTLINQEYQKMEQLLDIKSDAWGHGQLVDYSRKPAENYVTTLLNVAGYRPITVGTITRTEYGYIGYFGKFGDSLSDVQLISDLMKSEVYKVANVLNIPETIIKAIPSGDMFDGRSDESVFGTSFDFIEIYYYYLNLTNEEQEKMLKKLNKKELEQFNFCAENLETLHAYNLHKYMVKSPSVHLDLWPSGVKNGFDNYYYQTQKILNKRY